MTQACDLANGVELEFPQRGLRLRPYEVSTRAQRHKFSYARVKISIEAAELIEDYDAYREPVNLYIGGIKQHRYFVPDDGITYGEEQAWVELLDPLRILEEESISDSYNSVTLEELVDDIFSRRNDPHSLLADFEIVDEQVAARAERTMQGRIEDQIGTGLLRSALAWTVDQAAQGTARVHGLPVQEGGFDFDDHTLYDALKEVEEAFGVVVWASRDGILEVGLPETRSVNAIAVHGDPNRDVVNISGYHVGTSRNSLVYLRGRSSTVQYRTPMPITMAKYGDPNRREVHFVAEVEVPGSPEGNHGVLEDPIRVRSQQEMEAAIERKFVDAYMSHNSGSIEFNAMSSEDKTSLAELTVGDLIGVAPERNSVCGRGIEGGRFVVNRVLHNINARVGWQTTVEVSRVAPPIEIQSWVYDYETGAYYDNEDDMRDGADPVEEDPE